MMKKSEDALEVRREAREKKKLESALKLAREVDPYVCNIHETMQECEWGRNCWYQGVRTTFRTFDYCFECGQLFRKVPPDLDADAVPDGYLQPIKVPAYQGCGVRGAMLARHGRWYCPECAAAMTDALRARRRTHRERQQRYRERRRAKEMAETVKDGETLWRCQRCGEFRPKEVFVLPTGAHSRLCPKCVHENRAEKEEARLDENT